MDTASEVNCLLRNQLRDVAGQLLTLTERLCMLTQELEGVDYSQRSTRDDTPRWMPPAGFPTYHDAVNLALHAEQELARQGDSYLRGRATKRPKTGPETEQTTRGGPGPQRPCIICGGAHRMMDCPWRNEHCFRCGKPGHTRHACPWGPATTKPPAPRPDETETAVAPTLPRSPKLSSRTNQRPKNARKGGQVPTGSPESLQGPCAICGEAHRVTNCLWRHSHCNACGRPGHTRATCPQELAASAAAPWLEGREKTVAPNPQGDQPDGPRMANSHGAGPLRNHVVRHWPKGCGRASSAAPADDATSQNNE